MAKDNDWDHYKLVGKYVTWHDDVEFAGNIMDYTVNAEHLEIRVHQVMSRKNNKESWVTKEGLRLTLIFRVNAEPKVEGQIITIGPKTHRPLIVHLDEKSPWELAG